MNIVAIHQPNFLPWMGFFDKAINASTFILLDDVQFSDGRGNWTNRHLLLSNNKSKWVTMPISRKFSGFRKINEISLDSNEEIREKYLEFVIANYNKHPYYQETIVFLKEIFQFETQNLSELNIYIINRVIEILGISCGMIIKSSEIAHHGNGSELLCSLIREVNGTAYLCGDGSSQYLEPQVFAENDIEISFQNYKPRIYPQYNQSEFVPGLSILDAMMNCGFSGTRKLLIGSSSDSFS